jgi:hypothetical protein
MDEQNSEIRIVLSRPENKGPKMYALLPYFLIDPRISLEHLEVPKIYENVYRLHFQEMFFISEEAVVFPTAVAFHLTDGCACSYGV